MTDQEAPKQLARSTLPKASQLPPPAAPQAAPLTAPPPLAPSNVTPGDNQPLGCGWDILTNSCKDVFGLGWCLECRDFGNIFFHDCKCARRSPMVPSVPPQNPPQVPQVTPYPIVAPQPQIQIPQVPQVQLPQVPQVPQVPQIPQVPQFPQIPQPGVLPPPPQQLFFLRT
uniref:Uncharacterized protein n=1 Tax=Steinernema glaseri TaxID=37863 RepID=A0A1I8AEL8_9BILA